MPKSFGNTQDLVDIKEVRDGTVVMKNGGLRQIVMVGGVNFALKSETEQNLITGSYQSFLNGIDFPLQIVVHSRKVNIEKYLDGLARHSAEETSPLLQNQAEEYREFIRGFVQKNAIMEKTFLVIIPFYPIGLPTKESVGGLMPSLPFMAPKKVNKEQQAKTREAVETHFSENLQQLKQRVSQVVEGLFSMGLEAAILNDEQLIELFYNFYNPETVERENIGGMAQ